MASIYEETQTLIRELAQIERDDFRKLRLLAVGCSSSEVMGGVIGHASAPDTGAEIARAILDTAREMGFACAFQCCEHLNRALVVERETAAQYGLEVVCVVPKPKAGGSCATAAYRLMHDPVVVESVRADAGIDIGQTMVGMHLRPVAVPVRLSAGKIGAAVVTCARTRAKLIGGERAEYR